MYSSFNARALGLVLSATETIDLAASCGFQGVDLMVRDAIEAGEDLAALRKRIEEKGLRPGAFPLPMNWRGDRATFENELAQLPRYAKAAAELGFARTGTWVMPEWIGDVRDAQAFHVQRIGAIAKILADHGIRLGLEVIGVESSRTGRGQPYIHRLADVELLRAEIEAETGVPIGVLVDSWHLYAADEAPETVQGWDATQIVWSHVADVARGESTDRSLLSDDTRGLPGDTGCVASRQMLRFLAEIGYDGPVTAEPLARCKRLAGLDPRSIAKATFDALKSVWP